MGRRGQVITACAAGAWPWPVRLTAVGVPAALCAMLSVAVRAAVDAPGAKATVMVQVPPGATVLHALVAMVKPNPWPGSALHPETTSGADPLLVTTSGRFVVDPVARRPNARVVATWMDGAVWPCPVRLTEAGEPGALLAMFSVAVCVVIDVPGAKATWMVQVSSGTSGVVHPLLATEKPVPLAGAMVAPVTVRLAFPTLVTTTGRVVDSPLPGARRPGRSC